jgi:formamidopyrimidine-DNA glycosylase
VRASALQDRFGTGAATLNGGTVVRTDAWGKHLFVRIDPSPAGPRGGTAAAGRAARSGRTIWLHIHLGLYGRFTIGHGEAPAPQGALRLRLESERGWADLRGAITCELLDDEQRDVLISRLGEDPLQKKADPLRPWSRIARSRVSIAALLMQQDVLAGVGNVYRAEILFRQRIGPHLPGQSLSQEQWLDLWSDLRVLMRAGVRAGRIVTTRPTHRPPGPRSPVPREDSFYVYRRAGEPCRLCGEPVRIELLAGRNLYWCTTEQPD